MRYLLLLITATCVTSAQVADLRVSVRPAEVFREILQIGESGYFDYNSCTVWRDERIVISAFATYFDQEAQEETRRTLVAESIDGGKTWNILNRHRDWHPRDIGYTPGGDVYALFDTTLLRYQREQAAWTPSFTFPSTPREYQKIEFRNERNFLARLTLSGGTEKYFSSVDDGHTTMQVPTPASWCVLEDGTEVAGGMRRPMGWEQPEVWYNDVAGREWGTPHVVEALGCIVDGALMGDHSGRTWEQRTLDIEATQYLQERVTSLSNGTLIAGSGNKELYDFPLAYSTNYGATWEPIKPVTAGDELTIADCHLCRDVYLATTRTGSIYHVQPSTLMSDVLRWPPNSSIERPLMQMLVCPSNISGQVRVLVATDSAMQDVVFDTISDRRAILFTKASANTKYYWKYAWRATTSDVWGEWSSQWTWNSGADAFFTYLGHNDAKYSIPPLATVLMDGRIVRVLRKSRRVLSSVTGGRTWDSIAVVPDSSTVLHLWESPGGRLIVSTEQKAYYVDFVSRNVTAILPHPMVMARGDKSDNLFGATGNTAIRSYDDGDTWLELFKCYDYIGGVTFDVDGNVLYGASYRRLENQPGPGGPILRGGFQRYNVLTGQVTDLLPAFLEPGDQNAVSFFWLQVLRDGTLITYGSVEAPDKCFVSSDGKKWTEPSTGFLPQDYQTSQLFKDRDGVLTVAATYAPLLRQLSNGSWERLFEGANIRGGRLSVYEQPPNVSQARDGSFVLEGTWLMTVDAAFKGLRPMHRSSVPAGSIELAWNPVNNAERYEIEILPNGMFLTATSPTAIVQDLPPGRYSWRIRSVAASGVQSTWSSLATFRVEGTTHLLDTDAHEDTRLSSLPGPLAITAIQLNKWLYGTTYTIHTVLGTSVQSIQGLQPGLYSVVRNGVNRVVLVTEAE